MPVPIGPAPINTITSSALTGTAPPTPLMAAIASRSLTKTRAGPRWR